MERSIVTNLRSARGCLTMRINDVRNDFLRNVWGNFNQYEGPDGETLLTEHSAGQLRSHIEDVQALLDNHERRSAGRAVAAE